MRYPSPRPTARPIPRLTAHCAAGALLLLLLAACAHPTVGRWEGGLGNVVQVSIYKDGVASVNGVRCTWEKIDRETIRIEMAEGDGLLAGEMEIVDGGARISVGPIAADLRRAKGDG